MKLDSQNHQCMRSIQKHIVGFQTIHKSFHRLTLVFDLPRLPVSPSSPQASVWLHSLTAHVVSDVCSG
jgi:hypothetical protein